jgi:hypothetical protein
METKLIKIPTFWNEIWILEDRGDAKKMGRQSHIQKIIGKQPNYDVSW